MAESGDIRLEFTYDYMGRRVEKRVYTHDGSSWDLTDCRRFVYHNWLPLLEIGVTDLGGPAEAATVLRKYTWGKDLSGSLDGAGAPSFQDGGLIRLPCG